MRRLLLVFLLSLACRAEAADNSVKILNRGAYVYKAGHTDSVTVQVVCIAGYKHQVTRAVEATGSGGSVSVSVSTSQIYKPGEAAIPGPPQPVRCLE